MFLVRAAQPSLPRRTCPGRPRMWWGPLRTWPSSGTCSRGHALRWFSFSSFFCEDRFSRGPITNVVVGYFLENQAVRDTSMRFYSCCLDARRFDPSLSGRRASAFPDDSSSAAAVRPWCEHCTHSWWCFPRSVVSCLHCYSPRSFVWWRLCGDALGHVETELVLSWGPDAQLL